MKARSLWLYALMAILAGTFLYGTVRLLRLRYESGDVYPPYSSLRSDPLGARALYDGIDNLDGFSCYRNYTPFMELKNIRETTIFYQGLAPWQFLHTADEETVEAIEEIVTQGGRLFISFLPVSHENQLTLNSLKFTLTDKETSSEETEGDQKTAEEREKGSEQPPREEDAGEETKKPFSLIERWGLEFKVSEIPEAAPHGDDSADVSVRLVSSQGVPLPESFSWHTALYFSPQDESWRVIYRRGPYPALIERSFGEGTIVLSADSYFLSNEALRDERHPELLVWLVGANTEIMFDETHFGVMQSQGVATLIRKYHLEGFFIALFVLALLFVWKNATSLVPRREDMAPEKSVAGKDMMEGLVNVLRSNISSRDLLPVCFEEWKKSFVYLQKNDPETLKKISEVIQAEKKRPSRTREPVETYRQVCQILAHHPQTNGSQPEQK